MKVQNISGRALDLPGGGSLSPVETVDVESNRGLAPLLQAGLLAEVEEPKKKEPK